jgi:small subunit ribosomal protein S24e
MQIVDVIHPGRANVSRTEMIEQLAGKFTVGTEVVSIYGFETAFGGGKSTGFCLIYDSLEDLKKYEPKYRQARLGLQAKKSTSRKQIKEAKNRTNKIWGRGRRALRHKTQRGNKD